MKIIKWCFLTITILLSNACGEDLSFELNDDNYLIFGHFYGECFGELCVETFKLTEEKLFEDINDNYSGNNLSFIELGADKFDEVKDLALLFPNQLLFESKSTFGCPDCADGGGIFIQYADNGKIQSWRIDQDKDQIPNYLHNFVDKVNEKIALIND